MSDPPKIDDLDATTGALQDAIWHALTERGAWRDGLEYAIQDALVRACREVRVLRETTMVAAMLAFRLEELRRAGDLPDDVVARLDQLHVMLRRISDSYPIRPAAP